MSKALATKNVATVLVAVAMIFGFAFAFATPTKADVISDLQVQIQALLAQSFSTSRRFNVRSEAATFTQNLTVGSTGAQVMAAQQFLNTHGARVSATGARLSG